MVRTTTDNRGTLDQLTRELDEAYADGEMFVVLHDPISNSLRGSPGDIELKLSPRAERQRVPHDLYWQIVRALRATNPLQTYHTVIALPISPSSIYIPDIATFFDYAVVQGSRYLASRRTHTLPDSLVLVRTSDVGGTWAGEVQDVVSYQADGIPHQLFAYVKWFRPLPATLCVATPWSRL